MRQDLYKIINLISKHESYLHNSAVINTLASPVQLHPQAAQLRHPLARRLHQSPRRANKIKNNLLMKHTSTYCMKPGKYFDSLDAMYLHIQQVNKLNPPTLPQRPPKTTKKKQDKKEKVTYVSVQS